MIVGATKLPGVFEVSFGSYNDERGRFTKISNHKLFQDNDLAGEFKESFYSISKRNVLRGLHYQKKPFDHHKLVHVIDGVILDVVLDIRSGSETFGCVFSTELSAVNGKSLYIAAGFAHGFLTLSESATVMYQTTSEHEPSADVGIRWDSFGYDWGISQPIISPRDLKLPGFGNHCPFM